MAQVKIFGLEAALARHKQALSEAVHNALMTAFGLPENKRFQRFISLAPDEFQFPDDRGTNYTIIEISVFEGRSVEAKKKLIRLLFENAEKQAGISPQDLEITISETPMSNWGIRGVPADELALNYKVKV
ncbi:MAG: tautomerase family protein [Pseudomonadota bacterium]